MNTHEDSNHVGGILAHSQVYQDYERAFNEMPGLPINLRSVESWQLPHHGFQSQTHFNRTFRKLAGQSPTGYPKRLPAA